MKDYILCDKICIDCVESGYINDGDGVYYTGYNFFVDSNETCNMLPFIKETLSSYNVPVLAISLDRNVEVPKRMISHKDDIEDEIYSSSDYMINVSKKNIKKRELHR